VNPCRSAVRTGHETATVIQACQFVSERKIAQFCLQHALFRGATDRTHQGVHCRLIPSATEQSAAGLGADISQQTPEFSNCLRKETQEKVIICLFSPRSNNRGALRNRDSESTAMFRIATPDELFSDLKPPCRFHGPLLNFALFDPMGICVHLSSYGSSLAGLSRGDVSCADGPVAHPYSISASNIRSSPKKQNRRAILPSASTSLRTPRRSNPLETAGESGSGARPCFMARSRMC
jgi:hypothetical protein